MNPRRGLVLAVAVPVVALLWGAFVLAWIAATPGGLRFASWLAERASGSRLAIEAPEGRLLGPLTIGRLVHAGDERRIVAEELSLDWQPGRLLDGIVHVDRLHLGRLEVANAAASKVRQAPTDLTLPLAIRVDSFRIDHAAFGTPRGEPSAASSGIGVEVVGIDARFASDGRRHRLDALRFATARLAVEASGSLDGQAPFPVTATARVSGDEFGHPFTVMLEAGCGLRTLAVRLWSPGETLKADGEARFDVFAPQPLIDGTLKATGLDPASWVDGAPHARLDVEAKFAPEKSGDTLAGDLAVRNHEPGRLDQERLPLRELQARFRLTGPRVLLPSFALVLSAPGPPPRGDLPPSLLDTAGTLTGSAEWADAQLAVRADATDVDASAWHRTLKKTRASGPLTGRWSAAAQTLNADLRDPRFRLTLALRRSEGRLAIDSAHLTGRGGSLDLAGRVDPAGEYDLAGRLSGFDPAAFADLPKGRLNAALDARGRLGERPEMKLHFVLSDSLLAGRPLAGQGDLMLRPERIEQVALSLTAGDNRLDAHGRLGRAGDVLKLRIDAPRLEQIGLGGALTATVVLAQGTEARPRLSSTPAGDDGRGKAAASGFLQGTEGPPRGSLTPSGGGRRKAAAWGLSNTLPLPDAEWQIDAPRLALGDGRELRGLSSNGRWQASSAAGPVRVDLTIARLHVDGVPDIAEWSLRIDGQRSRHRIESTAQVGEHALRISGNGGLGADRVWTGELATLDWQGPCPKPAATGCGDRGGFRLLGPARLEAAAGRVVLGEARLAGNDWRATIAALRWSPGRLHSSGRFGGLPAALFPPAAASTLRLGGDWNIDFGQRVDGRIRVVREGGDLAVGAGDETLTLGLDRLDGTADFSGREVKLVLRAHGARAGDLEGRLSASLRPAEGGWNLARQLPWQGELRLDTPSIAWLSPLAGDNIRLDGRVQGNIAVGGTPAAPTTAGQVSGSALRVRLLDYGLDLGGGTLRLDLDRETIRLQRLELTSITSQRPRDSRVDVRGLTAQPGRLIAEGEIALAGNQAAAPRGNQGTSGRPRGSLSTRIDLRADRLVVSQLPDRWVAISGVGGARFADGRLAISGDLRIDAAYVTLADSDRPTLSNDVVVLDARKPKRPAPRVDLNLDIDLGRSTYFQGAGIDSRLAGQVRLLADSRNPLRASGSVHAVGGVFNAYGRELAIERGILNFAGLVDNPGLNVLALRQGLPVKAGVEVTGTLKAPKVRLVSEPDVPDTEKLSWMVLGRPPGGAVGAQDADLLLSAAMALRGRQGKGPLQSLMHGLGLDEFSLAPGSLGEPRRFPEAHVAGRFTASDSAAEQIATIGKRIGSNAVLSYEHSLTTAENILKLTVDLGRGVSLVGRVGANNALGLVYTLTFGQRPAAAGRSSSYAKDSLNEPLNEPSR